MDISACDEWNIGLPFETAVSVQKIKAEKRADGSRIKEADIVTLMQSVHIHTVDTSLPEDASRYVMHPKAYVLRNFWDPLIRLLAIMFFLEVPFTIAFHPEHSIGASCSSCSTAGSHSGSRACNVGQRSEQGLYT